MDKPIIQNTLQRVKEYIEHHHLLPPHPSSNLRVYVGLSGGGDSVALTLFLSFLGYHDNLFLTHCNFHLRAEESDRDEAFCRQFAAKLQLPIEVKSFDTRLFMKENKLSLEMACRQLRYEWWQSIIGDNNNYFICVGHHQDDSIETFLINLMRGTGIDGLTGIKPQNGHILRPLLCLGREDIFSFLAALNQSYITDSSNLETDFLRNKIRLQLLPLMDQIHQNTKKSILKTANHLAQNRKWISHAIKEHLIEKVKTLNYREEQIYSISIDDLKNTPDLPSALFHLLNYYSFIISDRGIERLTDDIRAGKKNVIYPSKNSYLCLTQDTLFIHYSPFGMHDEESYSWHPDAPSEVAHGEVTFRLCQAKEFGKTSHKLIVTREEWFDLNNLTFPLHIRHWREGDRISPFGMQGSKLVSDLFSDAHYNPIEKKLVWIIEDDHGTILNICGLKRSRHAPVTPCSKQVLHIKFNPLPLHPHE